MLILRSKGGAAGVILALAAAGSPAWGEEASWPDLSSPVRVVGGGER